VKKYIDIDWQSGNCRVGIDPEKFYPSQRHQLDQQAIEWCKDCPIVDDCAEWGIHHEVHGVWGGLSGNQRHMIRKRNGLRVTEMSYIDMVTLRPLVMEMEPVRTPRKRKSGSNDTTVISKLQVYHDTYDQHGGSVTAAAAVMGVKPQTLAAYLRHAKNTLGLEVRPYRDDSYAERKRAQWRRFNANA
jgi:hypothetical protein